MATFRRHAERHRSDKIGWLRTAVLGANDGIISTASLVIGVAAVRASHNIQSWEQNNYEEPNNNFSESIFNRMHGHGHT